MKKLHILLLTGKPGIGKTTVIRKLAASLATCTIAGFYTEEIRVHGVRTGFHLIGFDSEHGIIAHIDYDHRYRIGKYGVNVPAINRLAAATLRPEPQVDLYLVDEIGKMECLSAHFVSAMRTLLNTGKPVVATIAGKGTGFITEVKERQDVECWEVTQANREVLPEQVLAWLTQWGLNTS
jgi:nucleoside-triphosphatase